MRTEKFRKIIYSGFGIALVFVATIVIKIPYVKGYINFGDIFIFVISSILGSNIGFISGGIGSAFSDIYLGYNIYAPGTFIIKGLEGFIAGTLLRIFDRKFNPYFIYSAYFIAGLWMVLGYFIYETVLYGFATAMTAVPGNLVQAIVSAIVAIPLSRALKKVIK
ncbi:ECF transporter S component [Caloramator australicus]|uniref:Substrate-specific component PdxU2 of predicted pyridoxin-related ECF transporter n=1 Tax=Caloramator australicus RC3 TaxID=857293 RepID=I7LKF5_9CLOT|nr:ECF transporter S component [Caloramator australicus]CCJ34398.1 Substrate-specific component PdxU2 of predicted pyridoxin-related ECF transporter [Caloramator australicus RC3]